MWVLKAVGGQIFCALIGGGAGGMVGGATIVMWQFMSTLSAESLVNPGFFALLAINLSAAVIFAMFGVMFGVIIGFAPSLVTGVLLMNLARWRPFGTWFIWASAGALAGLAIAQLGTFRSPLSSTPAWIFGGATAMMAYWALALRIFKLRPIPAR